MEIKLNPFIRISLLTLLIFYVIESPLSVSLSFWPDFYQAKNIASSRSAFAVTQDILIIKDNLKHPSGVAVDGIGNIYVADTNNNQIVVFDPTGKLLESIGSKKSASDNNTASDKDEPGQFKHPFGIAVDNICNIYVADTLNDRIQEITKCIGHNLSVQLTESVGVDDGLVSATTAKPTSVQLADSVRSQDQIVTILTLPGGERNIAMQLTESTEIHDTIFTSLHHGNGGGTGNGGGGGTGGGGFGGRLVRHIDIQEIIKANSEVTHIKSQSETLRPTQSAPKEQLPPENNCCPINNLGPQKESLFNTMLLWIIIAIIIAGGISSVYILKRRQIVR